ncbi:MAG: outer membrane beta-barrel protein, partial [Planctomycetota bacterium]
FNTRPDELQLQQSWLYVQKELDTSCGFDIGGRFDYVYGTDAPNTQAFGIANNHWDNQWDNGNDYGHAIPQVYGEVGYGDVSVKLGKFYTTIGYEVVTAPDNFFYSHAYTFNNTEPFTHTGALATYDAGNGYSVWGGYVFGWDSGFEDNGDSFLGGASVDLTDDVTLIYSLVGGRFNEGVFGSGFAERGYMQSIVMTADVTDDLHYIFQSDYIDTDDQFANLVRRTTGVNQYLIYDVNDCIGVGARVEWWQYRDVIQGGENDVVNLTLGVNVKPHSNVVVRPEVRWDWDNNAASANVIGTNVNENANEVQTTFGMDMIVTF